MAQTKSEAHAAQFVKNSKTQATKLHIMTFDLSNFRKINEKYKLTVFGYIQDVQALFPSNESYYLIHSLIKQTCTLFYASIHEWDPSFISPNVKFIEETNSIKHIARFQSSSSFLKYPFDSGIHQWRFKIERCNDNEYWSSTIGIWNTKTRVTEDYPLRPAFT